MPVFPTAKHRNCNKTSSSKPSRHSSLRTALFAVLFVQSLRRARYRQSPETPAILGLFSLQSTTSALLAIPRSLRFRSRSWTSSLAIAACVSRGFIEAVPALLPLRDASSRLQEVPTGLSALQATTCQGKYTVTRARGGCRESH